MAKPKKSIKETLKQGTKKAYDDGLKLYEGYGKAVKKAKEAHAQIKKINKKYGIDALCNDENKDAFKPTQKWKFEF